MTRIFNGKEVVGGFLLFLQLLHESSGQLPPCCPPPPGPSRPQPHCRWTKCKSTTPLPAAATSESTPPEPTSPSLSKWAPTTIKTDADVDTEPSNTTETVMTRETVTKTVLSTKPALTEQCGKSKTGNNSISQSCSAFAKNPCDCRLYGCEYNPTDDQCYAGSKICEECEVSLPAAECRRPASWYIHEGVACKATVAKGNCTISEVIIAVNFGEDDVVDSAGITFHSYYDRLPALLPEGSRLGNSTNILNDDSIALADRKLYERFMFANPTKSKATDCLQYRIQLQDDAAYELAMKYFEYAAHLVGKRGFDVKINGLVVFKELDIIGLTGDMKNGLNLIINFQVAEEGTKLLLPGFPALPMQNGSLLFELCNGACRRRSSWKIWTISAFSVFKFSALPTPTETKATSTLPPPVVIPRDECDNITINSQDHPKIECHCHQKYCEFAIGQRVCAHHTNVCPTILLGNRCQRKDAYYAEDGVVCQMVEDGNCKLEAPIIAINVNGKTHRDKNGILFRAEEESDYIYNYNSKRRVESYDETFDVCQFEQNNPEKTGNDSEIYYTYVHGWSDEISRKPHNCIHYPVKLERDGKYELGLKFIETFYEFFNSFFTVKLNDQSILSRFDMVFHETKNCRAVDVYLQFEVLGKSKTLQIIGHANSSSIQDKTVNLSFCYGDLTTDCINDFIGQGDGDPNYSISGFYVARFMDKN